MKLRSIACALLLAVVSLKGAEARIADWTFTEVLGLDEKVAFTLIESMFGLIRMHVEHSHSCTGSWSMNAIVSNQTIFADGETRGMAWANIDDVELTASFDTASDVLWQTKGTKIAVLQAPNGVDELEDTKVADFAGFYAYDLYGSMASAKIEVTLDSVLFGERAIKDFWEVDEFAGTDSLSSQSFGHSRILSEGLSLGMKLGYPRAKWIQSSYLWRANGSNGYLMITGTLVAPDSVNAGCEVSFTSLVDNLASGFQTLSGEVNLVAPGT